MGAGVMRAPAPVLLIEMEKVIGIHQPCLRRINPLR